MGDCHVHDLRPRTHVVFTQAYGQSDFDEPATLSESTPTTPIPEPAPIEESMLAEEDTFKEDNDYVSMRAKLQPHENEFLADDGWYKVNSFQFATNNTEFCPSNNCTHSIEDGEFRPNSFTGGYVFDGKLKVTITEGDTKKSKFYALHTDLEKAGSEETPSKLTEILEGDIGFGGTTFDPDFEYNVVNGTLNVNEESPTLILRGE